MIDDTAFRAKLEKSEEILSGHNLTEIYARDIAGIRDSLEDYAFRILVIGNFNAGKSAFLNRLLGREENLLKEAQIPETTIAAELTYGAEEYLEAVDNQGQSRRFPFSAAPSLSPKDWRYLRYYVNHPFFEARPSLVLVDMPGLDSNFEWHNKAIAQYVSRGSAYILLVCCKDGTLKKSVADFLQETAQYPQELSVLMSQQDLLVDPDEVRQTLETIRQSVQSLYGTPVPVSPISVYDDDFTEKAERVILSFRPQEAFERRMSPPFNALLNSAIATLRTKLRAEQLDTSDIEAKIQDCEQARKEANERFRQEKRNTEKRYGMKIVSQILDDVKNALLAQSERLTESAAVSSDAFNRSVNSVIRPVLFTAVHQRIEENFEEMTERLDLSFLCEDNHELEESLKDALLIVKDYAQDYSQSHKRESPRDGVTAYQAVTGALAIVTDFVNPVIELAIVFLPTILRAFSKKSRAEKREDLKHRIETLIIPEICDKLEPQLHQSVMDMQAQVLKELQERLDSAMEAQEKVLREAEAEKEQLTQDNSRRRAAIEDDIRALESLRMPNPAQN